LGENAFKYVFYTLILAAIVYLVTDPEVLQDYTERLYVSTVSAPYRLTVEEMLKLDRQVRQVERVYERGKLARPDTRLKLLDLHHKYERLLVILSQSTVNPDERDEIMIQIRGSQAAINRWGREHGF